MVSIILVGISCDPVELPEPTDGDPVFELQGQLEGASFEVAAGAEAYFMHTAFSTTNDGDYRSLSRLEELDCNTGCAPGWQFEFSADFMALDTFFSPGEIPLLQPGSTVLDTMYNLSLFANSTHSGGASVASHAWSFFDGSTANTATVQKAVPGPGVYEVELTTITADSCVSYTRKSFSFSASSPIPDCEVDFYVDSTLAFDSLIVANYIPGSSQPLTLLWQDSIPGGVFTSFFPPFNEAYTICLEGSFEQGCTAVSCQTVNPPQALIPGSVCRNGIAGGGLIAIDSTVAPGLSHGVVIRHSDETGKVYASNWGGQESVFFFRIESVSPFEDNSLGQPTLQLGIEFKCLLYDEEGQPWKEAEGKGAIAVALPD